MGPVTTSIRSELSKNNMIFSEESSRAIYEMGNMELIELRQTSATMQCLSCLKRVPKGFNMCQCGVWLRPNQNTMDRLRTAIAALKKLISCLRNHFKRKEKWSQPMAVWIIKKSHGSKKRSTETLQIPFYIGPMAERRSSTERLDLEHGWSEEWVKYLDYIAKIGINHDAPCRQRQRYESTIHMRGVDSNNQGKTIVSTTWII